MAADGKTKAAGKPEKKETGLLRPSVPLSAAICGQ
jgi:hypothetical protein